MQLSKDLLAAYKADYEKNPINKTIAGAIARVGLTRSLA